MTCTWYLLLAPADSNIYLFSSGLGAIRGLREKGNSMGLSLARTLWKEWGHRIVVILSQFIQISLTLITSSHRRRFHSPILRVLQSYGYLTHRRTQ